MSITQFLHVSICVSDPGKSVPFYRDILGFKLAAEQHYTGPGPSTVMDLADCNFTVWLMTNDSYRLELIHFKNPPSPPLKTERKTNSLGLSHLTVGVDGPEKLIQELKAKAVKVLEHTKGNVADGFIIETYMANRGDPLPY
jgi:catechol 2,3-dioxygenase-like lactoylglutathione lyase family enzyme